MRIDMFGYVLELRKRRKKRKKKICKYKTFREKRIKQGKCITCGIKVLDRRPKNGQKYRKCLKCRKHECYLKRKRDGLESN